MEITDITIQFGKSPEILDLLGLSSRLAAEMDQNQKNHQQEWDKSELMHFKSHFECTPS
jgi:hypothetical protein